ncbi:sorbosone dehydrogenase family protein [Nitrososphaera sp.]|uniref:PQQ-dependent sugar dehydrogenase n=1 Tax=Nitrososphaera sp. TaxID=1971748 RepID=UPI00184D9127|nr:PQQ-dependent sugar dehydrogenase [Nitrososphaera sp.]NWG36743.1 PQQ-dependent sugar dehydrogenase [Nitrososphaera sp.]
MERDRRLALVAGAAVIIATIVTIMYSPGGTTIPLPEPTTGQNNTGISSGIQVIAQDLEVPWAVDFADDGRVFFTERAGRIRIIENGTLLAEPAAYINVEQRTESGLLGLALHPDFAENHRLYIYHTYANSTGVFNKVVMLTERDDKIIDSATILDGIPAADRNDGGRIKFGPDGKLYVATGDARQPELAQNANSLAGKILRINDDGTIPDDNPFPGSPVYSYGHRNVQGLAWDPDTGAMYASEHGESGNDEINLIKPGENYGWPVEECDAVRFEKPVRCFSPALAPGGIVIPTSDELGYKGDILMASLKGAHVRQIDLETGESNNILTSFGRIRDVAEAPDGSLYVLTSNRDGRAIPEQGDDKILKITSP